jgi:hypothetical protein
MINKILILNTRFEPARMHVDVESSWYGYNAVQCVDSTLMRVMVFQTAAGMCQQLRFMYVL